MSAFSDILRVAALPLDIALADRAANLHAVSEAFRLLPPGVDLVVLPELFSTGYSHDAELMRSCAERNTGATVDFLKALAVKHSVAIAGSFLASTPPHIYNRGFIIEPNGDETFYDKHHLFSVSREPQVFTAGTEKMPIVRFRRWNIALAVCYDLRFPAWLRNHDEEYDLLLIVANWPQARAYAWEHLLIARAIENQAYVVGADRGGEDQFGVYEGLTQVYDCLGQPIGTHTEGCPFITADLSKEKLAKYREHFPVSRDADKYKI